METPQDDKSCQRHGIFNERSYNEQVKPPKEGSCIQGNVNQDRIPKPDHHLTHYSSTHPGKPDMEMEEVQSLLAVLLSFPFGKEMFTLCHYTLEVDN